jgi:hypothetical protein
MGFTAKVHRTSRRKLGRGQHTQLPSVNITVTDSSDTATLTFDRPVVINGTIPLTVSGSVNLVTQTVVSPTVVTMLYSGPLTTLTYSLAADVPEIATFQGGTNAAVSGTFA